MTLRGLGIAMLACFGACSPAQQKPADPNAGTPAALPAIAKNATFVIDEARCEDEVARLKPFVVNWEATQQAEFSALTQQSIAFVHLKGCSADLLDDCKLPGQYLLRETPGNLQELSIDNEEQLYGEFPLGVASLGGRLSSGERLKVTYFVRGLGYATTPSVYRSQLGTGCEVATHFVVNYAAGAFEVGTESRSGASAEASALGASAGAARQRGVHALFRGGNLAACTRGSADCTAPLRLRLVPIVEGAPPKDVEAVARVAVEKPGALSEGGPRSAQDMLDGLSYARAGFRACYNAELGRDATARFTLTIRFLVRIDGTVASVDIDQTDASKSTFVQCIRDIMFSLRFRPAGEPSEAKLPVMFQPE